MQFTYLFEAGPVARAYTRPDACINFLGSDFSYECYNSVSY